MAATSSAMIRAPIGGSQPPQRGIIDDQEIQALIGPQRERAPAGDLPAASGGNHQPPRCVARYLRLLQGSNLLFLNREGDSEGTPCAMLVAEDARAFETWRSFDRGDDAMKVCFSKNSPAGRSTNFRFR